MLALNSYQTLAVGILLYYLGKMLKKNIRFLQTYCIPNPVIGGVLFALLNLILFESGAGAVKLDTVQQSFFMNMFFTSVGFSASYVLLKKGGRDVLVLTVVCAVLITFQDIIGVLLAKMTGLHPPAGAVCRVHPPGGRPWHFWSFWPYAGKDGCRTGDYRGHRHGDLWVDFRLPDGGTGGAPAAGEVPSPQHPGR